LAEDIGGAVIASKAIEKKTPLGDRLWGRRLLRLTAQRNTSQARVMIKVTKRRTQNQRKSLTNQSVNRDWLVAMMSVLSVDY
jgi:hypothetical protein